MAYVDANGNLAGYDYYSIYAGDDEGLGGVFDVVGAIGKGVGTVVDTLSRNTAPPQKVYTTPVYPTSQYPQQTTDTLSAVMGTLSQLFPGTGGVPPKPTTIRTPGGDVTVGGPPQSAVPWGLVAAAGAGVALLLLLRSRR